MPTCHVALQYFLSQEKFVSMSPEDKVELLEGRRCTSAFKGHCDAWMHFNFLGEWDVLQPALHVATELLLNGSHVSQLLDNAKFVWKRHKRADRTFTV